MKKIGLIALVPLGLMLTACGGNEPYGTDNSVTVNSHQKLNVDGADDTQIYDVTLSDGTRCIITDGNKSGGVWCESQAPVTP